MQGSGIFDRKRNHVGKYFRVSYPSTYPSVSSRLAATAQEGAETQTRTTGIPCNQGGLELLKDQISESEAERVGKEALELLKAEECPTGVYDLY